MSVMLNICALLLTLIDVSVGQKQLGISIGERANLSRKNQHLLRGFNKNVDIDLGNRIAWEFEQDDVFMEYATAAPTISHRPTVSPGPSDRPTLSANPSKVPSHSPTLVPTSPPSSLPSTVPSLSPSYEPTLNPSIVPSRKPSSSPSVGPSARPTSSPSSLPTLTPTSLPTETPTLLPTEYPSAFPSLRPSLKPSLDPTGVPSSHPSSQPTDSPSQKPSLIPTLIPSIEPTEKPSIIPSTTPSKQPTQLPSMSPTVSKAPSSAPTVSMAPSLVISTTPISQFRIVLTTPPNSPAIDPNQVVDLTEEFLDSYFKAHFASYMRYRGVDLNIVGSDRRQLQTITTIPCTGKVRFNLFASPDRNKVNDLVKNAFMDSKTVFFESLKGSESAGLQSLLDVKTNDTSVANGFSMLHVSLIVISISIVIVGVASSYLWKRTQENNVRKRLLRAAEYTRQYKGQPQLDDDCFRDIEPEPIQISDDNKALERMVMRARHDRGVMNRANELLLEQAEANGGMNYEINREVRFARELHEVLDEHYVKKSREQLIEGGDFVSDDDSVSVISQLSKGGSVATDPSSLVHLGYNDIESAGGEGSSLQSSEIFSYSQSKDSTSQQFSSSRRGESTSSGSFSGVISMATSTTDRTDNLSTNSGAESTLRGDNISLISQSQSMENGDDEVSSSNHNSYIQSRTTQDSSGSSYCTNLFSKY